MTFKKLLLLILFPIFSKAQEYEKISSAWNGLFIDYKISQKTSLRTEFHFRTIDFLSIRNQQIFRPSITFSSNPNVKFSLGYSFIKNFNRYINTENRVIKENNL